MPKRHAHPADKLQPLLVPERDSPPFAPARSDYPSACSWPLLWRRLRSFKSSAG